MRLVRNFGVEFIALVVGLGLIALLIVELRTSRIVIDAIAVPPSFRDRGFDGDVVAARIMDAARALYRENVFAAVDGRDRLETKKGGQDLQVSVVGSQISIRSAAAYLKGALCRDRNRICKPDIRFGGEITEAGGGVQLHLRLDRGSFLAGQAASHIAAMWDMDRFIADAARVIAYHREPYITMTRSSACAQSGIPLQRQQPTCLDWELREFDRKRQLLVAITETAPVGTPAWRNATFQLANHAYEHHRYHGSTRGDYLLQAINRLRRLYDFHVLAGRVDPATAIRLAQYWVEMRDPNPMPSEIEPGGAQVRSLGFKDQVISVLERAGELPWKRQARDLMGTFLLRVDPAGADPDIAAAVERLLAAEINAHGETGDLLLKLACAQLRLKRLDDAIRNIEGALALDRGPLWYPRATAWFGNEAEMRPSPRAVGDAVRALDVVIASQAASAATRLRELRARLARIVPANEIGRSR